MHFDLSANQKPFNFNLSCPLVPKTALNEFNEGKQQAVVASILTLAMCLTFLSLYSFENKEKCK